MSNIYLSRNTKHKVICFSQKSIKEFQKQMKSATFEIFDNLENVINIVRDAVGNETPMYAVKTKNGANYIVFGTKCWNLLMKGTSGSKGAKYKNVSKAYKFLYGTNIPRNIINSSNFDVQEETTLVYTDGSYNDKNGMMGVGYTIYYQNKEISSSSFMSDKDGGSSVKAECISAMMVIDRAIKEKIKDITIVHDNEHIHTYAVNTPTKKKSSLWAKYHNYIKESSNYVNIHFKKCRAHSGDVKNNAIDKLVSYKNLDKILEIVK